MYRQGVEILNCDGGREKDVRFHQTVLFHDNGKVGRKPVVMMCNIKSTCSSSKEDSKRKF